jgi:hypothetical protein
LMGLVNTILEGFGAQARQIFKILAENNPVDK